MSRLIVSSTPIKCNAVIAARLAKIETAIQKNTTINQITVETIEFIRKHPQQLAEMCRQEPQS